MEGGGLGGPNRGVGLRWENQQSPHQPTRAGDSQAAISWVGRFNPIASKEPERARTGIRGKDPRSKGSLKHEAVKGR